MSDKNDGVTRAPLDISALLAARQELNTLLAPLAASMNEVMAAAAPKLREWAAALTHAQQLFEHWEIHAPTVLKDAISAKGLIVPVSQMSFADLMELLALHQDKGETAVVERVTQHYQEIFAAPNFLTNLAAAWSRRSQVERRLHLLREALKAHELGMFAVSVPTLIAQFEGLVADTFDHQGMMNGAELRAHIATLVADETVTGTMLKSFVNDS